jgi:E1A/CREB-binding protein
MYRYVYCEKCYNDVKTECIEIVEDPNQPPTRIRKELFEWKKNNEVEPEKFVYCADCNRKIHQICALHLDQIHSATFLCDACLRAKNMRRKENRFTAKSKCAAWFFS